MEKIKTWLKGTRQPVLVTIILMLLCGLVFPLLMTGISALIFPKQANGGLIEVNGKAVGSEYVGQFFTEPYFMKGRPSAVQYNTYTENADGSKTLPDGSAFSGPASGSNNYGPSNPALVSRVEQDIADFLAANPKIKIEDIPTDLMTASGSGLDPHISPESAAIQIPAIAEASGIDEAELAKIVEKNTDGKLLGIFGAETVNVLKVNLDIALKMGLID